MFAHSCGLRASRRREEQSTLRVAVARWLIAAAMVVLPHAAHAHGIVGNRLFPGTLAFDDPAVMDELILPAVSRLKHPGEGTDVTDGGRSNHSAQQRGRARDRRAGTSLPVSR
jgi:hypothetical protein